MVAETHSHHDRIDPDDVLALLAGHLDTEDPSALTLADCGIHDDGDLYDLVDLLAEEYGERCLTPIDIDDLNPRVTVAELVDLLTSRHRT
jgi:hypothetical protein